MTHDGLLTIGLTARRSGLTTKALRHYDAIGLLRPTDVDPDTGYRRYGPEQVPRARTIRRLRDLDVPLDVIGDLLRADDPAKAQEVLARHAATVEARTWRLQRIQHQLRQMIDSSGRTPITDETDHDTAAALDPDERRRLAAELFNSTWTLLEKPDRTQEDDDRMVHAAHASRFHWGEIGGAQQLAVGEWQCSRVYAVLGRAESALHHGRRALEIAEAGDAPDWTVASAYEAIARAHAVAGDRGEATRFASLAREVCDRITDPEDREVIEGDLATLPI
ncbi:MAG TPA: helix-turn-helix domain-containing protein [Actinomycetota bacterium]|jgi:DNA-binding transcriptional MerR regulator|nr:helix-turn-helix domain-containing protein [Actinomycetota bacterium]